MGGLGLVGALAWVAPGARLDREEGNQSNQGQPANREPENIEL